MAQKILLVDLKKLKKSSELVREEAEDMLKLARVCIQAQEEFFRGAGLEPEQLKELMKYHQVSDEVKQAIEAWAAEFHSQQAQVVAMKKKEMKLSSKLLMTKKTRQKAGGSKKRCTKMF